MSDDPSPWDRTAWLAIGRALLNAPGRTLTAPDIAEARGARSSSATKRQADEMVAADLLELRDPPAPEPGTGGRRTEHAYFLPQTSADAIRDRLGERHPLG